MKIDLLPPKLDELKLWISQSPLRSLAINTYFETMSHQEFSRQLCLRLNYARFDPRLSEHCVELLWYYPERVDLNVISIEIQRAAWPHSWATLSYFAKELAFSNKEKFPILESIWCLLDFWAFKLCRQTRTEAFYFDSLNPASILTEKSRDNAIYAWRRYGYFALSIPAAKELLKICHNYRSALLRPSSTAIEIKLLNHFKVGENRWWSMAELRKEIAVSPSQLRFYIRKNSKLIKSNGKKRGRRYRLR